MSAVHFRNMPTLQINMTSCNEQDELFDTLLLMDTVLDNPCSKPGKTNAKDNSRTHVKY